MQHDVIIACDFKSAEDTFRFLDLFKDEERKPFLKIGMELFYAEGPAIVREIKRRGTPDFPRSETPRHSQHREKGDGRAVAVGRGHVQRPCGRDDRDDASRAKASRAKTARGPADRRDAAHLDQRGAHAGGTPDRRLDQRHDREIRAEHPGRRGWTAWSARRWKPAWCTGRAARSF